MVGINATWKDVVADLFCDSVRDGTHDSPKFVEEGRFLITSKNIRNGRVILETANIISDQDFADINRRSKVDQWDVLFSMIGTVGEVCLVREEEPPFAIKNIGLFKVGNELKAKWLYYYLCSPMTQALIRQSCRGASQQYIPLGELRNFPVRIPTKTGVMRKIVGILSAYDDLIENNRRRIALLEEAARLLYREWFVHFRFPGHEHVKIIDGLPEGWERARVADKFDTTSGGTPSRNNSDFFSGNINWVKTQELNEGPIFKTSEKITEEAIVHSSAKLLPSRTLLVSIYGANIGRTGLLVLPGSSNQACVALLPKRRNEDWIYAQLWIQQHREQIVGLAQGAAQTNISQKTLRSLTMIWPTSLLLNTFLDSVLSSYQQIECLCLQNLKLSQARDLLLPRLMNGEIAV